MTRSGPACFLRRIGILLPQAKFDVLTDVEPWEASIFLENDTNSVWNAFLNRTTLKFNLPLHWIG